MKLASLWTCLGLCGSALLAHEIEIDAVGDEGLQQLRVQIHEVDLQELGGQLRIQLGDGIQQAAPQTEAIPKTYADLKKVSMIIENMEHQEGIDGLGYRVTFRIINPTQELMQFAGLSEKEPITLKQQWRDGEWVDDKNREHMIDSRIRKCRIAPGQSAVFHALFALEELPARISVGYSNGHHDGKHMKVWSEKIER